MCCKISKEAHSVNGEHMFILTITNCIPPHVTYTSPHLPQQLSCLIGCLVCVPSNIFCSFLFTGVKVDIHSTDVNPPLNTTAYLMCTVFQYEGGLNGKIVFYSREKDKKSRKMGYVIQEDDRCSVILALHGYGLTCGDGTTDKVANEKVYTFVIKSVILRDYTYWYCHHADARIGSREILLGPSSIHYNLLISFFTDLFF